jgi:hypothetical protein
MTAPVIATDEPELVKIGCGKLCSAIFMTLISIGVAGFYTRVYTQASVEDHNTALYVWFLIHISFFWCGVLIRLIDILNILEYYGQSIIVSVWKTLQYMNTYPCKILKLSNWGELVTGCYIMNIFIPFSECMGYDTDMCVSMRMISIATIVSLCLIGLLLLVCGYLCYHYCRISTTRSDQNRASSNIVNYAVNTFVPISLPSSDTTCPICRLTVSENDSANWTSLSCNHAFHAQCISEWVKYKSTCPLCRAIISRYNTNYPIVRTTVNAASC